MFPFRTEFKIGAFVALIYASSLAIQAEVLCASGKWKCEYSENMEWFNYLQLAGIMLLGLFILGAIVSTLFLVLIKNFNLNKVPLILLAGIFSGMAPMLAFLLHTNLNLGPGDYAPFSDTEYMGAISGLLLTLAYIFINRKQSHLTRRSSGTPQKRGAP